VEAYSVDETIVCDETEARNLTSCLRPYAAIKTRTYKRTRNSGYAPMNTANENTSDESDLPRNFPFQRPGDDALESVAVGNLSNQSNSPDLTFQLPGKNAVEGCGGFGH